MKKILYGTTALLAAGMISSAANAAEPLKLQLGGFADWMVGYADQSGSFEAAQGATKYNSVDVRGDVEVHFKGSTKLDNGLTVGIKVELEGGQKDSDTIDESYITVDGVYGRLLMGSTKNVTAGMHVSAPELGGLAIEESDLEDFVGGLSKATAAKINSTYSFVDNDQNKISYYTPTYDGLKFGVTYTPRSSATGGAEDANTYTNTSTTVGATALAASYETEIGDTKVTTTAGYVRYENGKASSTEYNKVDDYNVGLKLVNGGYTFGGAYRWFEGDATNGEANLEGEVWNVGAAYQAGPYGVSLAYMTGNTDNGNMFDTTTSNDVNYEQVLLTGKYNLGAGVDSFATLAYADVDLENAQGNSAYAFVTGFQLAF